MQGCMKQPGAWRAQPSAQPIKSHVLAANGASDWGIFKCEPKDQDKASSSFHKTQLPKQKKEEDKEKITSKLDESGQKLYHLTFSTQKLGTSCA